FQRFSLRGLSKNRLEWGLICVAHNLRKWTTTAQLKAKNPIISRKPIVFLLMIGVFIHIQEK
ncbi:transposase, partial [Bacillus paranthracis]|nr:transposase [Bacillus paranthracis]